MTPPTSVSNWAPKMLIGRPLARAGLCLSSQSLKENGFITFKVFSWNGGSLKTSSVQPKKQIWQQLKHFLKGNVFTFCESRKLTWIRFSRLGLLWSHESVCKTSTNTITLNKSQKLCAIENKSINVSLFDYWNQLRSKIFAVEPSLEQDVCGVVHVVPGRSKRDWW